MELKSKKSFSTSVKVVERRRRAMKRLEAQLVRGDKPSVVDGIMQMTPLTERDKIRIKHEIAILKSRL